MVKHVVMFKLKDRRKKNVAKVAEKIRSMKGKIEVVKDLEVGTDFMKSERSFDLVLTVQLANKEDLEEYAKHPVHQPVLAYLKEAADQVIAVDYQV